MIKYCKPVIYGISALVYCDIVLHSNKGFTFLKINHTILSIIALLTFISLITLISTFFFRKLSNIQKIASLLFLASASVIINEFLFSYSFNQTLDFFIGLTLLLPTAFILNDLVGLRNNKPIYLVIIASSIVLISTLIFFINFYVPYEDYLMGFPIEFIHNWIRNWIISISIVLILFGILRLKTASKNIH